MTAMLITERIKQIAFMTIFLLSIHALPIPTAYGQFAYNLGESSFDKGVDVGLDQAGNAYFVGEFRSTLDFDQSSNDWVIASLNSDGFVVSYDKHGDFRFAFKISGTEASHEDVAGIAVADDGSFAITGTQPFASIDFDPDPIEEMHRSGELYIASYNSRGEVRWAVSPGGGQNTSNGRGYDVALDDEGNVYATGRYVTGFDFNPSDTTGHVSNDGGSDIFVASYDSTGDYRYVYRLGGSGSEYASSIVVDKEQNVYIAGVFSGEAFFDPEDTDGNGDREGRTATNTTAFFLASYDAHGTFRYAYAYDGPNGFVFNHDRKLALDEAGNVYMTGESYGTVLFDPEDADGDGKLVERTAGSLGSAFLASYTSDGLLRFATVLKGGPSSSHNVTVNETGDVYITGSFSGDVDFDPDFNTAELSSSAGADVFVASYDSTGAYRTAFNLVSTGLSNGYGIAVDELHNIALTGDFGNNFNIANGDPEDWRISSGQNDIFMARYDGAGNISVSVSQDESILASFATSPAYPNPFSTKTQFSIELSNPEVFTVAVYDLLGREVKQLHSALLPAGMHRFSWDGSGAAAGIYLIRVEGESASHVSRVALLR